MPGAGTRTFLEPDHYEASLRLAQIEAGIVPEAKLIARITWAELLHLQVLGARRTPRASPTCSWHQGWPL